MRIQTRTSRAAALLLIALGVVACASPGIGFGTGAGVGVDRQVWRVERYLTGVFTNREQAEQSPGDYFHIRLVCLPIWEERRDGPWLYVEQASDTSLDAPYRQRVYRLRRSGSQVISDVYTLPDEGAAVACWLDPVPLEGVRPKDLALREGCSIELVAVGDTEFQGSTVGANCPSDLNGASYATSHVSLREGVLESWDRGYDADGDQVWGADAGPYRFVREAMPADLVDER